MHGTALTYVAGGAVIFVGLAYCKLFLKTNPSPPPSPQSVGIMITELMLNVLYTAALEFVPSIEPPENMRDNDWGTEQV